MGKVMAISLNSKEEHHIKSLTSLSNFSPQTCVATNEGLSFNVSSSLLSMFSKTLAPILSASHQCTTSSTIILPDFTLITFSNLVALLSKGYSKQCNDEQEVQNMLDISEVLGIDLDSLYLGAKKDGINLFEIKQEYSKTDVSTDHRLRRSSEILGGKIKDIVSKKEPKENRPEKSSETSEIPSANPQIEENAYIAIAPDLDCKICGKVCLSISLLGYHYCKHFSKDINGLLAKENIIEGNSCLKCKQKFFDKHTLLCHVGVKHKYINLILQQKGLPELLLSQIRKKSKSKAKNEVLLKFDQTEGAKIESPENLQKEKIDVNLKIKTEVPDGLDLSVPNNLESSGVEYDMEGVELEGVKCFSCGRVYTKISTLRQHLCNHLREDIKAKCVDIMLDNNTCGLCKESLSHAQGLLLHLGTRHGILEQVLDEKGLPKFANIKTRSVKSAAKDYTVTSEKSATKENSTISSGEAPLNDGCTCLVCGKVCKTEESTKEHIKVKHGKLKVDIEESVKKTDKSGPEEDSRKSQNNSAPPKSSDAKCYKCDLCSKVFDVLSLLSQHMVRNHFWQEAKEEFQNVCEGETCLLCGKTFSNRGSALVHIGTYHGKLDDILERKGYTSIKGDVQIGKIKEEVESKNED